MFDISRYNISQQDRSDKAQKLASLNNRLKRKRNSEIISEPRSVAQQQSVTPEKAVDPAINDVHQTDGEHMRRGKKEKKKDRRAKEDNSGEIDAPSRNSHIIDKFRKVQERAARLQAEPGQPAEIVKDDVDIPTADLVPIPQPKKVRSKKPSSELNTGLPHYLRYPNFIQTSLSIPFTELNLSKKIQDNLVKSQFKNAFAVQAALLPVLLADHLSEDRQDILVSAPTGSGKTLAYLLPILQTLQTRRITRLRALVLVPTRELVQQVQSTCESMTAKLGLQIAALSTTRAFATEQSLLVNDYEPNARSNVDILICTPGRLVDHLKSTEGFMLRDLRFLVIDEGDRLLNHSFQNWSTEVNEAIKPIQEHLEADDQDALTVKSTERCQRLIFSATMSTDPSLLAQLKLIKPVLYLIQDRSQGTEAHKEDFNGADTVSKFTTPATLQEYFVHAPEEIPKPLVLLHVITRMKVDRALIFTNSNESAQKLSTLLNLCNVGRCEAFTGMSRKYLKIFASNSITSIRFLICSDLMARGIDITVPCVINYDSSITERQYVHRVGRTARAGNEGRAISIVERHEDKFWWHRIGGNKIRRSHEIQRVTLFPKPGRKPDVLEDEQAVLMQTEEDYADAERADNEAQEQGNDSEMKDMTSIRPQIELLEDNQDMLRSTYESALAKLQGRA